VIHKVYEPQIRALLGTAAQCGILLSPAQFSQNHRLAATPPVQGYLAHKKTPTPQLRQAPHISPSSVPTLEEVYSRDFNSASEQNFNSAALGAGAGAEEVYSDYPAFSDYLPTVKILSTYIYI